MKSYNSFIENNNELALTISLFNTIPIQTLYLRYNLLHFIVYNKSDTITRNDISLYLEDLGIAVSIDDALRHIESFGIMHQETPDRYFKKNTVYLRELCSKLDFRFPKQLREKNYTISEIKEILFENTEISSVSVSDVVTAIKKGVDWICRITAISAESKSRGLPAFWNCTPDGDIQGGYQTAGTCNSDALSSILTVKDSVINLNKVNLDQCIEQLLIFINNTKYSAGKHSSSYIDDWNKGAFLPLEDQPSAYHPTVDATWDAIISLSLYMLNNTFVPQYMQIKTTLIDAVGFILRTQLDDGGWGNYKYHDDKFKVISNIYTSTKVTTSLKLVSLLFKLKIIEAPGLVESINISLKKLHQYFDNILNKCERQEIKTSNHSAVPSKDDNVFFRILLCTGLNNIYDIQDTDNDFRARIDGFIDKLIVYLEDNWKTDYDLTCEYKYRVPGINGMNEISSSWRFRQDILITEFLIKHSLNRNKCLPKKLWNKIETSIYNIIQEQHSEHGHWNHPTGKRPFVVSTMFSLEVLTSYLQHINNEIKN